jgi:hypothetical protein
LRGVAASVAVAGLFGVVPPASSAAQGVCEPAAAQVFSWAGDTNWYAPVPGFTWDGFSSDGWRLSGGAEVVTTTLADGTQGPAVDLPSGATAVSPLMCVRNGNDYRTARGEVRDLSGTAGVDLIVSHIRLGSWNQMETSGTLTGEGADWTLPQAIHIDHRRGGGPELVVFRLIGAGTGADTQVSNLFVDPRMH